MTPQDIMVLISNYGFPMVACVCLVIFGYKIISKMNQMVDDMRRTVDHNTEVVENLSRSIEMYNYTDNVHKHTIGKGDDE